MNALRPRNDRGQRGTAAFALPPNRSERVLIALLAATLVLSVILAIVDPAYFNRAFTAEDGPVEYGTTLLLLLGAGALAAQARRAHRRTSTLLLILYAAAFFFAAGEEISWGQRLLGLETTAFFLEHNDQAELTLHNLVVGGVKLDELVFGNLLSVVLLTYLLALPFAWSAWPWVRRAAEVFATPVPRPRHAALALVATLVVVLVDTNGNWEVYEFAFAAVSLAIFIDPRNRVDGSGANRPAT